MLSPGSGLKSHSMLVLFVLVTLDLLIVVGNILVIVAASTSKKLRRFKTNIFIINLAVSDLLLGILVLPLSISNQMSNKRWHLGDIFCKVWLTSDVLLCTASIMNLTVISFDRYLAIRSPMRYLSLMTHRNCQILLSLVWIVSFIISFPTIFTLIIQTTVSHGSKNLSLLGNCSQQYTCSITDSSAGYIIYSAMGSYFIPLVVMGFFYANIYATVHRTIRGIAKGRLKNRDGKTIVMRVHCGGFDNDSKNTPTKSSPSPVNSPNDSGQKKRFRFPYTFVLRRIDNEIRSKAIMTNLDTVIEQDFELSRVQNECVTVSLINDRQELVGSSEHRIIRQPLSRMQREAKAARMLAMICGSFILCWLPFFIVYITGAFYKDIPSVCFDAVFWLGYCNSLLNPWIYAMFSKDFRRAYRRFLCRKFL